MHCQWEIHSRLTKPNLPIRNWDSEKPNSVIYSQRLEPFPNAWCLMYFLMVHSSRFNAHGSERGVGATQTEVPASPCLGLEPWAIKHVSSIKDQASSNEPKSSIRSCSIKRLIEQASKINWLINCFFENAFSHHWQPLSNSQSRHLVKNKTV